MTRRLARAVAVALVCAFASTPAFAARHHANHHRHSVQHHRVHVAKHRRVTAHRHTGRHRYHVAKRRHAQRQAQRPDPRFQTATLPGGYGFNGLVAAARASLGESAHQLGVRADLWCMAAVNKWLERTGHRGSGSDLAKSALALGPRIQTPQVGSLAVMTRRGGGHVGVVSGVTSDGDPIVISGNHNHEVAESVYPQSRVIAYVLPR